VYSFLCGGGGRGREGFFFFLGGGGEVVVGELNIAGQFPQKYDLLQVPNFHGGCALCSRSSYLG